MEKHIIRNRVKNHILTLMQEGKLAVGKTINLAALSRELSVSVTPIREALSQLEEAQVIKAEPNRGFVIAELSLSEALDLYQMVSQLEVIAIENSDYTPTSIKKLKTQQLILQQTHTNHNRLKERFLFHSILIENCRNKILVQLVRSLKTRILFYEQAYLTDAAVSESIDNQNDAIIQALEEGNVPTAALILKMNWMSIMDYLKKRMVS